MKEQALTTEKGQLLTPANMFNLPEKPYFPRFYTMSELGDYLFLEAEIGVFPEITAFKMSEEYKAELRSLHTAVTEGRGSGYEQNEQEFSFNVIFPILKHIDATYAMSNNLLMERRFRAEIPYPFLFPAEKWSNVKATAKPDFIFGQPDDRTKGVETACLIGEIKTKEFNPTQLLRSMCIYLRMKKSLNNGVYGLQICGNVLYFYYAKYKKVERGGTEKKMIFWDKSKGFDLDNEKSFFKLIKYFKHIVH